MVNEASKSSHRRSFDRRFATRFLRGNGIDVGSGSDPISKSSFMFPFIQSIDHWDIEDGDAMLMETVADNSYDFLHSSHCLEHLTDPYMGLGNWIRIVKSGGFLIVTVPDEDLYEQRIFPSKFNPDHKFTFTISKDSSWSPASVNIFDLLGKFNSAVRIIKIELLDSGFDYNMPTTDQTLGMFSESAIEFILEKL